MFRARARVAMLIPLLCLPACRRDANRHDAGAAGGTETLSVVASPNAAPRQGVPATDSAAGATNAVQPAPATGAASTATHGVAGNATVTATTT